MLTCDFIKSRINRFFPGFNRTACTCRCRMLACILVLEIFTLDVACAVCASRFSLHSHAGRFFRMDRRCTLVVVFSLLTSHRCRILHSVMFSALLFFPIHFHPARAHRWFVSSTQTCCRFMHVSLALCLTSFRMICDPTCH